MAQAAEKVTGFEPQLIKVSSKRQITIPSKVYKEAGFSDYALVSWDGEAFSIRPLDLSAAEGLSDAEVAEIAGKILAKGYEGEAFQEKFDEVAPVAAEYYRKIDEALESVKAGNVAPFEEMQQRMRAKYGLDD